MKIDAELEPPFFELSDTHKAATWLLAPQATVIAPPAEIQRRWDIFRKNKISILLKSRIENGGL